MKRRCLRILVLLWLGWYLCGPLAETIDCWDSPQEEAKDIARDAGGIVTILAAAFSITISLARKICERCLRPPKTFQQLFTHLIFEIRSFTAVTIPRPAHSPPPVPLRI
jgi:hypothetical protein